MYQHYIYDNKDVPSFNSHCLTDSCARENAEKVRKHIQNIETLEGNFSQNGLWKLKKKLCPMISDPPMAKVDKDGNLVTAPNLLRKLYLETYFNRLKHREMKKDLLDIYDLKMDLWSSRLTVLNSRKTSPWTRENLDSALSSLKKTKQETYMV